MKIQNYCEQKIEEETVDFIFQSNDPRLLQGLQKIKPSTIDQLISHLLNQTINSGYYLFIQNKKDQQVYLFRDPLGIYPIYYLPIEDNNFTFSDQQKILLKHSNKTHAFDWGNAFVYFNYRKGAKQQGCFNDLLALPPANYLHLNGKEVQLQPYWSPARGNGSYASCDSMDTQSVAKIYGDLILENIDYLIENQEKIILSFSGGLDSSILAALVKDRCQLETFSIAAPFFYENGDLSNVLTTVDDFQLNNTILAVHFEHLEIKPKDWINMICHLEHPYGNSIHFLKSLMMTHISTHYGADFQVISGYGSDQFNGGNSSGIAALYQSYGHDTPQQKYFDGLRRYLDYKQYAPGMINGMGPASRYVKQASITDTPTSVYCWDNWIAYQANYLSGLDLGIEFKLHTSHQAFFPFLDHRIVELVLNTKPELIEDLFMDKAILRYAMQGRIPAAMLQKSKHADRQHFLLENYAVLRMFTKNNCQFIDELFEEEHEVVDVVRLKADLVFMLENRMLRGIEHPMTIINSRILEKHLGTYRQAFKIEAIEQVKLLNSKAYSLEDRTVILQKIYEQDKIEEIVSDLKETDCLSWASEIQLLRNQAGEELYIMKNGSLEYHITNDNENLINILLCIDEEYNLLDVSKKYNISEEDMDNIKTLFHSDFLKIN